MHTLRNLFNIIVGIIIVISYIVWGIHSLIAQKVFFSQWYHGEGYYWIGKGQDGNECWAYAHTARGVEEAKTDCFMDQ